MKRIAIGLAGLMLSAGAALSQQADWKADEQVTDIGHHMFVLTGTHAGNITVAIGKENLIVVDAQFAQYYPDIKAKIAGITKLPVKYLINSHYHADHSGGDEPFVKDGAILVTTANAAKYLAQPPKGSTQKPAPADALPTKTYSGASLNLSVPGVKVQLLHLKPAHTDGDTVVLFPAVNVLATGDLVGSNNYPNIDVLAGGSIDGMIAGADFIIAHCDDKTIVVPGHGPVTNKAGVIAYRDMLKTSRDRIAALKAKGVTEDQMVAEHPLADLDAKWTGIPGSSTPKMFPRLIYRSLP